jgi:subtilisin family serine protease
MMFSFLVFFLFLAMQFAYAGDKKLTDKRTDGTIHDTGVYKKYKADEILVKFREGVSDGEKINLHKKYGSIKINDFKSLRLQHLKVKNGLSAENAVKIYKNEPDIEYAEPNYLFRAQVVPGDQRYNELWGMEKIVAPTAWDYTTGNNSVVVAVIDSGIDYNHPDLAGNIWVNESEISDNNIDDDENGYVDDVYGINAIAGGSPMDDNGHGTHVSGTIGAVANNGIGVAGINWNIKIVACKFLDGSGYGSTDGAIQCLQYIKSLKDLGLNVVATNNSWGGDGYSQALYDAINAQQDILFIAAAGNNATNNDTSAFYPAAYSLPNLLAVAATDLNDSLASFSNYGAQTVHLGAPGKDILSTLPGSSYGVLSGTSMAAPHVTGLAALLKSQDMNREWRQVKNLLLSSGDSLPSLGGTTITGKRINAANSMACNNKPVFSALKQPSSIDAGVPLTVSVLSINCNSPEGPVTATTSGGNSVPIADDGVNPDMAADDGIFTASWTPSQASESLIFYSPNGGTLVVPPLAITTMILPEGSIGNPYNASLTAKGGIHPYRWDLAAGTLPPGLALDDSGTISGSPSDTGTYPFVVRVTDSVGGTLKKNLSFSIVNHFLIQSWVKEYLTTSNQFGTPEGDIALDGSGNILVTGNYYGFWHMPPHVWLAKYDSAGNKLWQRNDIGGDIQATNKALDSIAVDGDGNIYGAGYVNDKITDTAPPDRWLTVKYDPSGNMLWDRSFMPGIGGAATAVAVDGNGNVYVTGYGGRGVNSYTGVNEAFIVTTKYDSSGALLWTKTYGEDNSKFGYGIAADSSGNIYVTGHEYIISGSSSWHAIVVLKYDTLGNLLWSKQYNPPTGYGFYGKAVALDNNGDVYIGGQGNRYSSSDYFHLTLKYDTSGNFLWSRQHSLPYAYTNGLAVDHQNNIYITGDYFANGDPNGVRLVSTIKYDSSGNFVGSKEFYNSAYRKTWSRGIAVDNNNDPLIVGFSNNNDLNVDFFTLKYTQLPLVPLHMTILGTGSGTINIVPGTACTTSCTQYYNLGAQLTLTAASDFDSVFSGWGGACAGTENCAVTMNGITQVNATFTLLDLTPPVTTATPSGGTYASPQSVTLAANEPATIYYTTDGSTPTTASPVCAAPIAIPVTTTLKFFARDLAGNSETVRTATYIIDPSLPPTVQFKLSINTAAGYYPVAVATGDFNGDGKPDLATANQNAHTVSVLIGIGDGSFQPKLDYPVGSRPNSVAIADFDGNGKIDLAVLNIDTNNLSILKGNGDGTLAPKMDFPVGSGPSAVVTGDFNADGRVDLAVSYYSISVVTVLPGNGNGTFAPGVDYVVGAKPQSLATGDFNNDSWTDLVVGNYDSNTVSILQNIGNGTFLPKRDYSIGTGPTWVTTGDFNDDQKLDLAVTNWATVNAGTVSVLLGNGDCTFSSLVNYGVGKSPKTTIAKDFNNDTRLDLMVVNTSGTSNNVSILVGNGNGTFQSKKDFNAVAYSQGAASADFNDDGQFDLAVTNPAQNNFSILLNDSGPVTIPISVNIAVSPASPQPKGTSVTFTGMATGGSGSYEYQFWYRPAGSTSFIIARDYSPINLFNWDTAPIPPGIYEWFVYARNAGSTAPYQAISQILAYTINAPLSPVSAVSLTGSPASPQVIETSIIFTAAATGGTGNYEYQFWYRDTWSANFIMARDYGPDNLFIWDTASVAAANYEWRVYARNSGSTTPYEAISQILPYTINAPLPPVSAVSLTASPASPQVKGTSITFSAAATGGIGNYEYQFWYRDTWSANFIMVRDYGSGNFFIWDTGSVAVANYQWRVYARNSGSTAAFEASQILPYSIMAVPPVSSVSLAASPASPQVKGVPVTLTGTAAGGSGNFEYQFWYRPAGSPVFTMARDYASSSLFIWDTASIAVGNYDWIVYARNSGSTVSVVSEILPYTINTPPVSAVSLGSAPLSPVLKGTTVTFVGTADGGSGNYEYQFWYRPAGAPSFILARAYDSARTSVWETAQVAAGSYEWLVYARNIGSTATFEAVSDVMTYLINNPPVTSVTISASPSSPQKIGTSVTFSGRARGGVAPYQYRFLLKDGAGNIIVDTDYGSSSSYVWNTTGLVAGTYSAEVRARSAGNSGIHEAASAVVYQLTPPPVTSVTLSATPASPQSRGAAVTFTGQAAGSLAPYQYKFIAKSSKGKIVASSDYSTSDTWIWNTSSSLTPGTYTVEVDARSAGSLASKEVYTTLAYQLE